MATPNPVFDQEKADARSAAKGFERSDRSRAYERYLLTRVIHAMAPRQYAVELWDGFRIEPSHGSSIATVHIHSRSALTNLLRQGDVGFGDAFSTGEITVEGDLIGFLIQVYQTPEPKGIFKVVKRAQQRSPRANTQAGSRENIHHHYDIGNDFYKLWLDREMQYTCAYFPEDAMEIEAAQQAKMDHVCRKLQLRPGDRVAEAGCGWGGLARHMALHYGAIVSSWNVSAEQVRYATDRAKSEGYDDRVSYVLDDYRNIKGEYDAFVSVGMLEHVGCDHYPDLGDVLDRCLTAEGRGLIHTIGRNRPRLMNAWIEKRIFPGAYPPTLGEMMDIFEPHRFSVLDVENLRLHYAKTLEAWLSRFDASHQQVTEQFDENFTRAWRLYLAGSKAAFLSGALQLFQVVFTRERNNNLAASRTHLYS